MRRLATCQWAGRLVRSGGTALLFLLLLAACSTGTGDLAEAPAPEDTPTATASATSEPDPAEPESTEDEPAEPATAEPAASATPAEAQEAAGDAESESAEPAEAADEEIAESGRVERFEIVPEESTAGYSIQEIFISDNNTLATAVGVTSDVQGAMSLDYNDPAASEFETFVVDISTLTSDRSRRDRAIRARWLESSSYPLATFDVTEVRGFADNPEEGVPVPFQLVGDMTVKETTREVVWDVVATLQDDRLAGTATLDTMLADFDIPVPSIADILRVTDGITLTLEFVMERNSE